MTSPKGGLQTIVCTECGALVADTSRHVNWHRRVRDELAALGELEHSLSVRVYDLEVSK